MGKTNRERILDYLRSISPEMATNAQIRENTSIKPHQQVYMLTQELIRKGLIQSERRGREWVFWVGESVAGQLGSPSEGPPRQGSSHVAGELTPRALEELARSVMSVRFGVPLTPGKVPGAPKRFDTISPSGEIVGDAKYYTRVGGTRLPPAKFSVIAEHVWLLEKTGAPTTFLVFGNDRQVPMMWLKRYGNLLSGIAFYFLADDGSLEHLAGPDRTSA